MPRIFGRGYGRRFALRGTRPDKLETLEQGALTAAVRAVNNRDRAQRDVSLAD